MEYERDEYGNTTEYGLTKGWTLGRVATTVGLGVGLAAFFAAGAAFATTSFMFGGGLFWGGFVVGELIARHRANSNREGLEQRLEENPALESLLQAQARGQAPYLEKGQSIQDIMSTPASPPVPHRMAAYQSATAAPSQPAPTYYAAREYEENRLSEDRTSRNTVAEDLRDIQRETQSAAMRQPAYSR